MYLIVSNTQIISKTDETILPEMLHQNRYVTTRRIQNIDQT